jgi:DNA-binding HxlR family transcriptional regulator
LGRGYNQHCTLAYALDRIGERWTLLIVRELLAGPRRYTDLAQGLVTVPSNILASRLRDMETLGLVERKRLPAPAESVVVYELTEEGAALSDAVTALSRWGMRSLPPTTDGRAVRAHWLIPVMEARFDPEAAAGVDETYQLQIDDEEFVHFTVQDGHGKALPGPAPEPAVAVSADAETLVALANGAITIPEATRRGAKIQGTPDAVQRMLKILPPPTPAGLASKSRRSAGTP